MKFVFADSLDVVDPTYDFDTESVGPARRRHQDECYAHELMDPAPYDGVLISLGVVGNARLRGKYTFAQAMQLRREGARKFLRLDQPRFESMMLMGDCGAFSYVNQEKPPHTTADILDFYADSKFTHGCSLDHVIYEYDRNNPPGSAMARSRFEITLDNAREFHKLACDLGKGFTSIGVAQGWSPASLATSAERLEQMGYTYIALGGLVPLRAVDISLCLTAVRERISPRTRIHLLGFAKAEQIGAFGSHGIASFDSTSPLLRSFKDARFNYYALGEDGGLQYYTAIRIPQALQNSHLTRAVKEGKLNQEQLLALEREALGAVRGYDRGSVTLDDAVEAVATYGCLLADDPSEQSPGRKKLYDSIRASARRTLEARAWAQCPCVICREASVEVVIFRGSNRNKRRGFHNLGVFYQHLQRAR